VLLPLAVLPLINEVATTNGNTNVFCGKPAMVFENPRFASSDLNTTAAVGVCRTGFAGRWRLSTLIAAAAVLIIIASVVWMTRASDTRSPPPGPGGKSTAGMVIARAQPG
jgi:hypothetical protein